MKTILLILSACLAISMTTPIHNNYKTKLYTLLDNSFGIEEKIQVTSSAIDVDAQIALILDTSGSMNGLLEQAKSQLWNIVNELASAKKDNEPINFEIALYEYGNDGIPASHSYVRRVTEFTSDIDLISKELFGLSTNGGNEYCGAAIGQSLTQLNWSSLANLKTIYIAGNESFDQGGIPYQDVCLAAQLNDITINTIFCGSRNQGIGFEWKNGANFGDGSYFNIDHNSKIIYHDSPYDDEIADLNKQLNDTYIHYGEGGKISMLNQRKQDNNAKVYGKSNFASRSIFKSNSQYNNSDWDLVDAYEADDKIVDKAKHLPSKFQNLNRDELRQVVKKISEKRREIQEKISALGEKRKKHIDQLEKSNTNHTSLNNSINKSIKEHAIKAGFSYDIISKEPNAKVDFTAFLNTSSEAYKYRKNRLIDAKEFIEMSKNENTIILDTRSKEAFIKRHINGAVHLNFSDFTKEKLEKIIPDKKTRILIYCNNNFISNSEYLALKSPPLALNIPTFINLYGYGYRNIFELNSLVKDDNSIIKMSQY